MGNRSLLFAFIFVFVLGVTVGCIFFILFQSYLVVLALIGFVSVAVKIPSLINKIAPKKKV
jgi:hypothetical protein